MKSRENNETEEIGLATTFQCPLLLTWINFNPSIAK